MQRKSKEHKNLQHKMFTHFVNLLNYNVINSKIYYDPLSLENTKRFSIASFEKQQI